MFWGICKLEQMAFNMRLPGMSKRTQVTARSRFQTIGRAVHFCMYYIRHDTAAEMLALETLPRPFPIWYSSLSPRIWNACPYEQLSHSYFSSCISKFPGSSFSFLTSKILASFFLSYLQLLSFFTAPLSLSSWCLLQELVCMALWQCAWLKQVGYGVESLASLASGNIMLYWQSLSDKTHGKLTRASVLTKAINRCHLLQARFALACVFPRLVSPACNPLLNLKELNLLTALIKMPDMFKITIEIHERIFFICIVSF